MAIVDLSESRTLLELGLVLVLAYFGPDQVFQLAAKDKQAADFYTRVTVLFDDSASHDELLARIEGGAEISITEAATTEGGELDIQSAGGMPMFVNTPGQGFRVIAAGDRPKLEAGQELIGLIDGKAMTR